MICKRSKVIIPGLVLMLILIIFSIKTNAGNSQSFLFYEGLDYTIRVKYGPESGISKDAALNVTQFYEGSKEFQQLYSKTEKFISQQGNVNISDACFFDIRIIDNGKETEPDSTVEVIVDYKNGIVKKEEDSLKVIHFIEDGDKELLDVTEKEKKGSIVTKISFEQESFSIIGMVTFDSVDSNVKSGLGELICGADTITVQKKWSDGNHIHEKDTITVSLFELLLSGKWKVCDQLILRDSNEWQGKFENLDNNKNYSIKETKVSSENMDITATYKSEIDHEIVRKWCRIPGNKMNNGSNVLLLFGESPAKILRKSADYNELNLRTKNVSVIKDEIWGEYCSSELGNNNIWKCIWNESTGDWSLYNIHGNTFLTLVYDENQEKYLWTTCYEMSEGSHLNYDDGKISATVSNVTKYIGDVSGNGPYEGVDPESKEITKFQLFSYITKEPAVCKITNTKNDSAKLQEIDAGIITEKKIDYLGDGIDNPDTEIEESVPDTVLKDLYRLKLGMKMQTDRTGLDLLMVIDVSSSMRENSDAMDESGNKIKRSEALQQALNEFIPSFLEDNDRNRVSIVAFEQDSIILQEWTSDLQEIVDKINYQVNGEMPLYAGEGTNYESALIRAHEALSLRGYSENEKAMIFLSDGEPTVCIGGNDDIEKGNVTVFLGAANLASAGIENTLSEGLETVWVEGSPNAENTANEAIASFRKQHPEMIIGTIAFNTKVKDCLKNLATGSEYVIQIQNGTPKDLIETMELIIEYRPSEIVITDELSENIELYEREPDFKITVSDEGGEKVTLFTSKEGISEEGKKVLNRECPIEVTKKTIKVLFQNNYIVPDSSVFELSFNVNASQAAFNKFADAKGIYSDKGDEETDLEGNLTSSGKRGFYSNGDGTKVSYNLNGAEIEKKYRKPVVQVREGVITVQKTDLRGENIGDSAIFELYREAEEGEKDAVKLEGYDKEFVKVNEGKTDEYGVIEFNHLRLTPFDEGYPYYLVEKKAPEGFEKIGKTIKILLYDDFVKIENGNNLIETTGSKIIVKNAEPVEFSFTKVAAHDYEEELTGAEFRLSVLDCDNISHSHGSECWKFLEKQISDPRVEFKKMTSGNTYMLEEIKSPDGYVCASGFWLLEVNSEKNIEIKKDTNLPELKKKENGEFVLENEQILNIPVTGGIGTGITFLTGLMLITGGIIMKDKKKYSGIWMLCLAFLLVFQMFGTTALAIEKADRGAITVSGVEKGVYVQSYRLMDVIYDYDVQQPKNPVYQWVDNVASWMISNYPEYIDQTNGNAVKKEFSTDSEGNVAELYDKLAGAIKNGAVSLESETVAAEGEEVSVDNLKMGNYFILIEGGAKVYRPLSANVVPEWKENRWEMTNPVVEAKSSEPTITKTVADDLKEDHADIGDTVSFELNAVIPSYPENALAKKFIVSDKLSQGLTFITDSVRVYGVNNQTETLLENSYIEIDERPVEEKMVSFALDFNYDIISKYESLKITYDTILNENVIIGETGNSNHAFLDYNNNPYVNTSWKSDEDKTTVYTYGMRITKIDEKEETVLEGAEFTLTKNQNEIMFSGENGNYHVAAPDESGTKTLKTDKQGMISISGLDADTYFLTETKAPAGYVKLQNPIKVVIKDVDMDGKPETGTVEGKDGYVPLTVKNDKGFTLPVTGGIGTVLFNITGIVLIGSGLLCMVRFSRKNKKNR